MICRGRLTKRLFDILEVGKITKHSIMNEFVGFYKSWIKSGTDLKFFWEMGLALKLNKFLVDSI